MFRPFVENRMFHSVEDVVHLVVCENQAELFMAVLDLLVYRIVQKLDFDTLQEQYRLYLRFFLIL